MIVVFGAFGKTGRVAAELLEAEGKSPVRRVTRDHSRTPGVAGHEVVRARLSDDAELARALNGAAGVYAMLPDDFSAKSFRAERRGMAEAMSRAILRERVPRVVLLSSAAAALGEDGHNGLGADLAYFERLVCDTPASVSVLRASYFQDNLLQILPGAAQTGIYPSFFGSRAVAIPTIAALDVGKFIAQLLLEPQLSEPEIVDLIGPSYSSVEMAAIAGKVLGRALSIVDVPATQQEQTFRQWMSDEAARAMSETFRCLGSGRALPRGQRTLCGQTRLEQVLQSALARTPAAALEGQS